MSDFKDNEVMEGEFHRLTLMDENSTVRRGPWWAACLSGYTGPTWVFYDLDGHIVPLSAVQIAWRPSPEKQCMACGMSSIDCADAPRGCCQNCTHEVGL